jgi:hypothetical protein
MDEKLDDLEMRLRNNVQFYLTVKTDREFWKRENKFRYRNTREIDDIIKKTFEDFDVDEDAVSLLQYCVWMGMNMAYPDDPDQHIDRVVDNMMEVYILHLYAILRSKMILNL